MKITISELRMCGKVKWQASVKFGVLNCLLGVFADEFLDNGLIIK